MKHIPVDIFEALLDDLNLTEAKMALNLKKGKLHEVLGIDEDKKVTDYSVSTLFSKAKDAINSGKVTYQRMIAMLNVIRVYNKNKNPQIANKIKSVQEKLKKEFKDKNKKK